MSNLSLTEEKKYQEYIASDIKLNEMMINHLNLQLEKEGSCLRYIKQMEDESTISYSLMTPDKYINSQYGVVTNYSNEFDIMVRDFFKKYGVTRTGYWNTLTTLIIWK